MPIRQPIPEEIISTICSHLLDQQRDVSSAALTSKAFCRVTDRHRFKSITFKRLRDVIVVSRAILRRKDDVARFVRKVELRIPCGTTGAEAFPSLFTLLGSALSCATSLSVLEVYCDVPLDFLVSLKSLHQLVIYSSLSSSLPCGISLPHLTTLHIPSYLLPSPNPTQSPHFPSLHTMTFTDSPTSLGNLHRAMTNLCPPVPIPVELAVTPETKGLARRGCPSLTRHKAPSPPPMMPVERRPSGIRTLSLHASEVTLGIMQEITLHLRELRSLFVSGIVKDAYSPYSTFLKDLPPLLHRCPSLLFLTMSSPPALSHPSPSVDELSKEHALLQGGLYTSHPTLESITFPSGNTWVGRHITYDLKYWEPGEREIYDPGVWNWWRYTTGNVSGFIDDEDEEFGKVWEDLDDGKSLNLIEFVDDFSLASNIASSNTSDSGDDIDMFNPSDFDDDNVQEKGAIRFDLDVTELEGQGAEEKGKCHDWAGRLKDARERIIGEMKMKSGVGIGVVVA